MNYNLFEMRFDHNLVENLFGFNLFDYNFEKLLDYHLFGNLCDYHQFDYNHFDYPLENICSTRTSTSIIHKHCLKRQSTILSPT